jgi:hypothetical protein
VTKMPANIIHTQKDPEFPKKNRGPGVYYHRGHNVWSKYDWNRDEKIVAKGYKVSHTGLSKRTGKTSRIPQAGDGYLIR